MRPSRQVGCYALVVTLSDRLGLLHGLEFRLVAGHACLAVGLSPASSYQVPIMAPDEYRQALEDIGWSPSGLADALDIRDVRLCRRWGEGTRKIPPVVTEWLSALAAFHRQNPAPEDWGLKEDSTSEEE
jgi:hypothetical protein